MKKYYSLLFNLCAPGLGHYYLGQKLKAVVFFITISFSFYLGLSLDFDHYYWYKDIKTNSIDISFDQNSKKEIPLSSSINPQWNESIHFFNLNKISSSSKVAFKGHTKPGLTLEISNKTLGTKVQTQSDYKGFFNFPPLSLQEGKNEIIYGAANNFFALPANREINVASYDDAKARYRPGTLEKMWHFTYLVIFPILSTPVLHFTGGTFQSIFINWWDKFPITKNNKSIPSPLKDIGFYFLVMACMLNLIILFDGFDTAHNEESKNA
ncbi:MAG: hypothetical protein COB02_03520 [Candidatus Cloacimonadota bacterium]|nr:MAG: hypothetical protein COB02_03520 [Candidatus Cloacimonadota bacterium]